MGKKDKESEGFLGLGSNLGDRQVNLRSARERLAQAGLHILQSSCIYETPPWGKTDQEPFLNQVLRVAGHFEALEVLDLVLGIETDMGRKRLETWGPRLIDLDVLDWGGEELNHDRLKIPHPYMHERAFVLLPLAEIAPEYVHPVTGMGIFEMMDDLSEADKAGIVADPSKNL